MSALGVLVVPTALLTLGALAVLVGLVLTARSGHALPSEVAAARRHSVVAAVFAELAFLLSFVALGPLAVSGAAGTVARTAPWVGAVPLAGAALGLVVLAVGELTWPRPSGARREAHLNPRTLRELVTPGWRRLALALTVLGVAVPVAGGLLADRTGRSITTTGESPAGWSRSTASPFPGWAYAAPQLVALTLVLLLLGLVLRLVLFRAAVVHADVETDNRLRTASVVRAVRLVVAALSLTVGGDLFFGGGSAARVHVAGWQHTGAVAALFAGVLLGVAGVVLILAPAPRLRRTTPEVGHVVGVGPRA